MSEKLTPEALVDLQVPQNVCISPSGRQAVYSLSPVAKAGEHPISSLWLADVGEEYSARQVTLGKSNDQHPKWCADEKSVAFVSDRAEAGKYSVIYLLPASTGEAYPVTEATNKAEISTFEWSPDGKHIAFLSPDEKTDEQKKNEKDKKDVHVYGQDLEFNRLRILDVGTKKVSTLVNKDAHVKEFAWSEGGTDIVYTLQELPDRNSAYMNGMTFERVSIADHRSAHVASFPGSASGLVWFKTDLYFIAGYAPDSVCTSQMVYVLSLDDGHWSKYAHGEKNCAMELRRTGRSIAARVQSGLHDQVHTVKSSIVYDQGSIVYDHPQAIATWDLLCAEKEDVLVLGRSTINSPVEIYSIKGGEDARQLSQHGTSISKLLTGATTSIFCTAEDGTALDGLFWTPSNESEQKAWPTVVIPHGGPYYRVAEGFDVPHLQWAPWLLSLGFAVLSPNYRGGSSHGETFAKTARGGMGTTDYSDVVDMLKHCISKSLIDESRVMIGGWSQGGFLSYLAVTRKDFVFKAAICGAGVSDWPMMCMTSDLYRFESELAGGAPWDPQATFRQQSNAVWNMKDVKTPVLILHGEADERVPLSQAWAFHRGCLHHKIPCEMVTYPREPHLVAERHHRIDMLERLEKFCKKHIG